MSAPHAQQPPGKRRVVRYEVDGQPVDAETYMRELAVRRRAVLEDVLSRHVERGEVA